MCLIVSFCMSDCVIVSQVQFQFYSCFLWVSVLCGVFVKKVYGVSHKICMSHKISNKKIKLIFVFYLTPVLWRIWIAIFYTLWLYCHHTSGILHHALFLSASFVEPKLLLAFGLSHFSQCVGYAPIPLAEREFSQPEY